MIFNYIDPIYLKQVLDKLKNSFKSVDIDMINVNLKSQDSIISVSLDGASVAYDSGADRFKVYDYATETYVYYRGLTFPGSIAWWSLWYVKRYWDGGVTVSAGSSTSITDYWQDWTRPDMRIVVGAYGYVTASGGKGVIEIYVEGKLMASIEYTETSRTKKYTEFIIRKENFIRHMVNHPTDYGLKVTIKLSETTGSADFKVDDVDIYMAPTLYAPILARDENFRLKTTLEDALASIGTDKLRVTVTDPISAIISATTKVIENTNYSLSAGGTYTLINYSGRGRLHEVTIISSSSQFKITIVVDGTTIWDKSYSDAASITDEVVAVSAFQREDGKYIYHLTDIPFNSSIKVDVVNLDTANPITLDYIFAKYEAG